MIYGAIHGQTRVRVLIQGAAADERVRWALNAPGRQANLSALKAH